MSSITLSAHVAPGGVLLGRLDLSGQISPKITKLVGNAINIEDLRQPLSLTRGDPSLNILFICVKKMYLLDAKTTGEEFDAVQARQRLGNKIKRK